MNYIKTAYNSKHSTITAFILLGLALVALVGIVLSLASMPVYSARGLPSETAGVCLSVEGRMPAGYESHKDYELAQPWLSSMTLKTTPSSCNEVRSK